MKELKKEEPEMVSVGMATPKSGADTIKRAETRVADTDTYKGRVLKLPESEMVRCYGLPFDFRVEGPVPWKMMKFNPGSSQILSKVFLAKNMQLKMLLNLYSEIQ